MESHITSNLNMAMTSVKTKYHQNIITALRTRDPIVKILQLP